MERTKYSLILLFISTLLLCSAHRVVAQRTQIRGFVDAYSYYQKGKANFGLGEQDLFITSEITERLSFLGETVFKYSLDSPTDFDISVERIILKYNYAGNHSVLIGKHHTPINYWNDTYHHGRVFFPTVERPLVFSEGIIPLHTTGISLQGQNLGRLRFGYDVMVGNGLGSGDIADNNPFKSLTAAVHVKPVDGFRLGASLYHDVLSKGSMSHNHSGGTNTLIPSKVTQNIMTASVSYTDSVFSKRYELLAESSMAINRSDSLGMQQALASYAYAGFRITDKIIPYIRLDNIQYRNKEVYYLNNNVRSFVGGLRYEISYLAVLKLEYQHIQRSTVGTPDKLIFQVAVGF
ncbi:hypothetical protein SAMN06265337_0091 [Hymenobacter gelipurpurascens]|uniref:Phosphate-selective porin O and P n=1 Tax=Hymenobacter gelipurpurascens TaxID=89968 RepID=A0A212T0S1_9BACT|nr:hypothetical protein [Hymenobacter gelipurpurascens]SNC59627.1 hypothetical protein SAMN06265337_0091 [Hymenobacter gelipurpurascens]